MSSVGVGYVTESRDSEEQPTLIEPDKLGVSGMIPTKVIHQATIPSAAQGVVWVGDIDRGLSFVKESKGSLKPGVIDVGVRSLRGREWTRGSARDKTQPAD